LKTEKQIREVMSKLFQNPLEAMFDVYIHRTLKWVLGEDDEFLDYLLEKKTVTKIISGHGVIFEPDEKGGYVAYCVDIPSCVSQGDTLEDAIKNIKEALELMEDVKD